MLPTPAAAPTALPSLTPTATPLLTPTPEPAVWGPLVVIDAGHGGKDLGARHFDETGHMDFYEAQVNLDLALRVRDLLIARGYR
ncbi:MAG: N-acetylmuramoyl-L-alanine amidase, partial [Chloroflexi bacterium]|nr:N-acetylmuramoyl-L-alanine amidase [Chloroflexota bacterium]